MANVTINFKVDDYEEFENLITSIDSMLISSSVEKAPKKWKDKLQEEADNIS